MSTEIVVEVGREIYRIAEHNGWLDKLKDAFRTKHRVLVLGSTGAGKTQFLRSFGDIFAEGLNYAARTQFPTAQRFDIDGHLFEFIDTPGQTLHQSRRMEAIVNSMKEGFSGIINVVCYGYHEYGLNPHEVLDNGVVKDSYLQSHREIETRLINEWAHLLSNQWILTVGTKADIWWDSRDIVLEHYRSGEYHRAINNANPKIETMVSPYSSISSKFYGILPTSGDFNDEQRKLCRNQIFRELIEAITRVKV